MTYDILLLFILTLCSKLFSKTYVLYLIKKILRLDGSLLLVSSFLSRVLTRFLCSVYKPSVHNFNFSQTVKYNFSGPPIPS